MLVTLLIHDPIWADKNGMLRQDTLCNKSSHVIGYPFIC